LPHEFCYHCGRFKEGTMARKVSTETRQDLLQAVRERYRGSLKEEVLPGLPWVSA
jgi:hypothetical protein